ncbi:MAG: sulfur transferase domain-containing protein [Nitrospinae bacterium]|nr:sulfur transferase domain-containing protein [Nitrospinota bacterium]
MDSFNLAENLVFGSQPGRKDMERLADVGIKTVVNLRFADEEEPELPPDAERESAQELGMNFVHIPVSAANISDELSGEIHQKLSEARKDGPVYVH